MTTTEKKKEKFKFKTIACTNLFATLFYTLYHFYYLKRSVKSIIGPFIDISCALFEKTFRQAWFQHKSMEIVVAVSLRVEKESDDFREKKMLNRQCFDIISISCTKVWTNLR